MKKQYQKPQSTVIAAENGFVPIILAGSGTTSGKGWNAGEDTTSAGDGNIKEGNPPSTNPPIGAKPQTLWDRFEEGF